jgi:hypothetical protein
MPHEWHRDATRQKQADNLRSGPRRFPLQSLGVLNANVFVLSIDVALNFIQVACLLLFRGRVSERLQQLTKASKETECVPSDLRRRMRSHGSLAGAVACVGTALQY